MPLSLAKILPFRCGCLSAMSLAEGFSVVTVSLCHVLEMLMNVSLSTLGILNPKAD